MPEARELIFEFALSILGQWLYRVAKNGWMQIGKSRVSGQSLTWPNELLAMIDKAYSCALPSSANMTPWKGMDYDSFWTQMQQLTKDPLATRWLALDKQLHLSCEEITVLVVMVVIDYDLHLLRALRLAMAEATPNLPRWGFVVRMLAADDIHAMTFIDTFNPDSSILFTESILHLSSGSEHNIADAMIYIDKSASNYLYGMRRDFIEFQTYIDIKGFDQSLRVQLDKFAQPVHPTHFAVHGPKGSGRLHVCRGLARVLKCAGIWTLDLTMATDFNDAIRLVKYARSMATLHNAMIVVTAVPELMERWNEAMPIIAAKLHASVCPIAWIMAGDEPKWLRIAPDAKIWLTVPTRTQREEYWLHAVSGTLSRKWIKQLAGQFILTKGQIDEAICAVESQVVKDEDDYYRQLCTSSRTLSKEGLGSLAIPEPGRVSFDQLIVSSDCETALKDLLMYARHRKALAKDWGFERSMAYGLGLAALFSGPPGTGKTFAAQVIATELQLELYRVDVSQIVSKYVGETEKHLAELFNAAEQGEILLLFDEADSIFGKRTEVKSSVDRYANLEINYLLQRLERFSGVSILTSNFDSAIDEAFMRRIRFKVPFEIPDERARFVLWKKFLPPAIPRSDDVNLNAMAEIFELSGGHIKEAVLRAASIAYGSTPQMITQDLLVRSAQLEYKKIGKLAPKLDSYEQYNAHSKWN